MIEVEIKVRISDPSMIRKKFAEFNGVYKLSLHHEDIYFNMPKGLRDFKQTDEALRLRKSIEFNRNISKITQSINYFITYKGKKIDATTKTREEIEVKISEIEDMKNLLKLLGFREVFTVIKERELYDFTFRDTRMEALIDYIPILEQHFVEVELMSESSDNVDKSKDILFKFLEQFGINKEESIRKSYLELISDKLKGI
ncbi:MAG: class IV adenylate cyclase [Candidatus Lokiarchaeota archaeon]|nr:class IV adenylate cyclase [Candidatus Lokiarchaeota archaeon]